MSRTEHAQEAARLRERGLLLREIAAEMGVAISTVGSWLHDPDGSKLKARKDGYRGRCTECGTPTDGSSGRRYAPALCVSCMRRRQHDERFWTRARVLVELRAWADDLGRSPVATEATQGGARVPCVFVQREFGSWAAGLEAAGLTVTQPHLTGEALEQACAEARRLYEADRLSGPEIAELQGIDEATAYFRIRRAGGQIRRASEAQALRWAKAAA